MIASRCSSVPLVPHTFWMWFFALSFCAKVDLHIGQVLSITKHLYLSLYARDFIRWVWRLLCDANELPHPCSSHTNLGSFAGPAIFKPLNSADDVNCRTLFVWVLVSALICARKVGDKFIFPFGIILSWMLTSVTSLRKFKSFRIWFTWVWEPHVTLPSIFPPSAAHTVSTGLVEILCRSLSLLRVNQLSTDGTDNLSRRSSLL